MVLLAALGGVAWQLQQAGTAQPGVRVGVAVAGAAMVALAFGARRSRRLALAAAIAALAALAWAATDWRTAERLADALPPSLEGYDLVVTGVVAGLPQVGEAAVRFRFEVDRPSPVPPLLSLGWYAGFHEDVALSAPQRALKAGQRWRFTVRLKQPHGNANPHGFDLELWLFEQGIRATGAVRDATLLDPDTGRFGIDRWRQTVRDAIVERVPDARAAGVLAALAIGDQAAIGRDDWALFRDTGVAHLMSISGLHVTMFAWLASLGIGALWRRSSRLAMLLPAQQAARWGGVLAAGGYALLSGWGVPAQRTVWMLAAVTVLRSLGLRWPWPLVLLAAAVVVVALDPWALLQPGFWLSFAAVGFLMAGSPRGRPPDAASSSTLVSSAVADPRSADVQARPDASTEPPRWRRAVDRARAVLLDALRTQVVATVGLAPLTLLFFNQLSPIGFVANLIAIPVVTLLVTPLALAGLLAPPLWSLGADVASALSGVLAWLVAGQGAAWIVPASPLWAQLAGLGGGLLVVMRLPWRLRLMGFALVLPLALPPIRTPADGEFEIVSIDVGQGLATLVRTHSHVLLFDAGPQYLRAGDAGERVVVPLLRALGAARVDTLVLSHRDLDHVGGARAVLGSLQVARLTGSVEPWHPLRTLIAAHDRCEAGQRWAWDGVVFSMLGPPADAYERPSKTNALSCVLRIEGARRSALLTGDIGRDEEAALVATHDGVLASDVLVVPHHGSRTSSSAEFLSAVSARSALVSAGYRNRFNHPAADVVARHQAAGSDVLASTACGAWTWRSDGPPDGVCHRESTRRAWRHPDRARP